MTRKHLEPTSLLIRNALVLIAHRQFKLPVTTVSQIFNLSREYVYKIIEDLDASSIDWNNVIEDSQKQGKDKK